MRDNFQRIRACVCTLTSKSEKDKNHKKRGKSQRSRRILPQRRPMKAINGCSECKEIPIKHDSAPDRCQMIKKVAVFPPMLLLLCRNGIGRCERRIGWKASLEPIATVFFASVNEK